MAFRTTHDVNGGCGVVHQNLKSNFGSKDTPGLVQFFKSRPHFVLTSAELKFRSLPEDTSKSWVVKSRGTNHYVEELRYNDPDALQKGMHLRIMGALRNQQLNPILWTTIPKILFRLPNGSGLTFLPMSIDRIHFGIQHLKIGHEVGTRN